MVFCNAQFLCAVAGEPTHVSVVQESETSILVTWVSQGDPVTGYKIFFEPGGGSEEVTGGNTESYLLENLQSGEDYNISIVALSAHLPSTVVGPITPTSVLHVVSCLCQCV